MSDSGKKLVVIQQAGKTGSTGSGPNFAPGMKVQQKRKKVRIAFVIDRTGSMDWIALALVQTLLLFVDEARKLDLDVEFEIVAFGDLVYPGSTDRIDLVVPWTADPERVKAGLRNMPDFNGYGNSGESSFDAIEQATSYMAEGEGINVLVLFTDDYAHQNRYSVDSIMRILAQREYLVFAVTIPADYYRRIAEGRGGYWVEISTELNMTGLLRMLSEMAAKVAEVAKKVVGAGNVTKYLLETGKKK